jgi:glycosyltransferase involved in cell wall biosynthesis
MRVLLATDAFPPVCGGSGWSTYELARGLRARGQDVLIAQPKPGTPGDVRRTEYDGFRIVEFGAAAPNVPFVRNYYKNERLHHALEIFLRDLVDRERIEVIHAQHVMTCLPAIRAAHDRRGRIPAVCTVRDYWPVCYWSDLLHTAEGTDVCPACSTSMMTRCIRPRAGVLWPLALPMIPYMRANLSRKREGLSEADAVIAVSSTIAADLRTRAPELAQTRMEIIPNPVNVADLRRRAAAVSPISVPYALYLGKLAPNKGTSHLIRVIDDAGLDWPLVIAGDGPEREQLHAEAARSSREVRFLGWVDQDQAATLLGHASMLIFPSRGPESLSRVLIEASALGVPIAAMNTGGTADIVAHNETGLLSRSPADLARDVRRLRADDQLRHRLGQAAMRRAQERFDSDSVVMRVEALYRDLLERRS